MGLQPACSAGQLYSRRLTHMLLASLLMVCACRETTEGLGRMIARELQPPMLADKLDLSEVRLLHLSGVAGWVVQVAVDGWCDRTAATRSWDGRLRPLTRKHYDHYDIVGAVVQHMCSGVFVMVCRRSLRSRVLPASACRCWCWASTHTWTRAYRSAHTRTLCSSAPTVHCSTSLLSWITRHGCMLW